MATLKAIKSISDPSISKRLGKSRFGRGLAQNLELQRKRGDETRQKYAGEPLSRCRTVVPKTEAERERLWEAWTTYFQDVQGIDPDSIWIGLCEDANVSHYVREFFAMYIDNSIYERPCIGPEEKKTVRGVNSAITIDGMWKTLLGKAEASILEQKRREDPLNRGKWTLLAKSKGHGPVYEISKWIEQGAPTEHNLTRRQTFEKKGMTPEDIMILLGTLWKQARHIPCSEQTRLAFHGAVLIAGIGGFRPGEVMNLTYKQVAFELVRDPLDSSKRRLVAAITIQHNKQKTNVIERSQHRQLSFSITVIPCKPICLASLLVARAIADRAFDANFCSLDDILNRPDLGTLNSLPLAWVPGIEDKQILPISYPHYLSVWHRTLQVSGLRDDKQRPYSLRVGAGSRIHGSLGEPTRNYVLGNSRDVYLQSYQTRRVAHDLVNLAFGQNLPDDNTALFNSLRHSFLQRDPDAPLYPEEMDVRAFEERQDIRDLRAQYQQVRAEKPADDPDAKRIAARIHYIRHTLSRELVEKRRVEWFLNSDKLRATGNAVTRAPDHGVNPFRSMGLKAALVAETIGEFMESEESDYEQGATNLVDVYLAYLRRSPTLVTDMYEKGHKNGPRIQLLQQNAPEKPSRCLFGCGGFANRGNLSRHNTSVHFKNGDFHEPFQCPECRLGGKEHIIKGPMHWSNHVETVHGRAHAPDLPTCLITSKVPSCGDTDRTAEGRCLICSGIFTSAGGFTRHFKVIHVDKDKLFQTAFYCPECARQQVDPVCIKSTTEWETHLVDAHEGGGKFGCLHSSRESRRQKRARSAFLDSQNTNACDDSSNKRQKTYVLRLHD